MQENTKESELNMKRILYFDKIIIIESLHNERKTGKELYDDCLHWQLIMNDKLKAEYKTVTTANELSDLLVEINKEVQQEGVSPILHFEVHGNKYGFGLSNENDVLSWYWLKQHLTEINLSTRNGLLVTMATCYGAYLINIVSITDRSPFWAIIAPDTTVNNTTLCQSYQEFYTKLLDTLDGDSALNILNQNKEGIQFNFLNTEALYCKAFKGYLENHCNLAAFKERLERIKKDVDPEVKAKLGEAKIEEFAKNFLLSHEQQSDYFEKLKRQFLMIDLFQENAGRFNLSFEDLYKKY